MRRTAMTGMAKLGVQDRHAEAVLNHVPAGVLRVYDRHMYDEEKKLALTKWVKRLESLITPYAKANSK